MRNFICGLTKAKGRAMGAGLPGDQGALMIIDGLLDEAPFLAPKTNVELPVHRLLQTAESFGFHCSQEIGGILVIAQPRTGLHGHVESLFLRDAGFPWRVVKRTAKGLFVSRQRFLFRRERLYLDRHIQFHGSVFAGGKNCGQHQSARLAIDTPMTRGSQRGRRAAYPRNRRNIPRWRFPDF
ncbi:MAG: hypothetical protein WDN28_25550 [Chthoniobacter sp.]